MAERVKELSYGGWPALRLPCFRLWDLDAIDGLKKDARYSAAQERNGLGVVSQLVDRKDAIHHHFRLGANKRREHEPGAIAQLD